MTFVYVKSSQETEMGRKKNRFHRIIGNGRSEGSSARPCGHLRMFSPCL